MVFCPFCGSENLEPILLKFAPYWRCEDCGWVFPRLEEK